MNEINMRKKRKVRKSPGYIAYKVCLTIIMLLLAMIILYPLLNLLAISFSNPDYIVSGKVSLIPVGFNIEAYKIVLGDKKIYEAYGRTILVCFLSVILSLFMLCLAAYPLAFGKFKTKKLYAKFITITMFLSAGIIPNYFVIYSLHLNGKLMSLVVGGLLSAYNIIVVRSYFDGLPKALIESARVDGANDFEILFRIVIPCSKPILATVALWIIVGQWNNYQNALINLDGVNDTLQVYIAKIISDVNTMYGIGSGQASPGLPIQVRDAAIVCCIIPILIVFPFAQKFLVSGVTVGSVKE